MKILSKKTGYNAVEADKVNMKIPKTGESWTYSDGSFQVVILECDGSTVKYHMRSMVMDCEKPIKAFMYLYYFE